MIVKRRSPISGVTRTMDITVSPEQVQAYNNGAHVQDAFSHLTPAEREFIITGTTEAEWADTFHQTPDPNAYPNSKQLEGWD